MHVDIKYTQARRSGRSRTKVNKTYYLFGEVRFKRGAVPQGYQALPGMFYSNGQVQYTGGYQGNAMKDYMMLQGAPPSGGIDNAQMMMPPQHRPPIMMQNNFAPVPINQNQQQMMMNGPPQQKMMMNGPPQQQMMNGPPQQKMMMNGPPQQQMMMNGPPQHQMMMNGPPQFQHSQPTHNLNLQYPESYRVSDKGSTNQQTQG